MKSNSLLFNWYVQEFKDRPEKVRAVQDLLKSGHNGLAESAAVRSLKAKYSREEGIKVNGNGASYFI